MGSYSSAGNTVSIFLADGSCSSAGDTVSIFLAGRGGSYSSAGDTVSIFLAGGSYSSAGDTVSIFLAGRGGSYSTAGDTVSISGLAGSYFTGYFGLFIFLNKSSVIKKPFFYKLEFLFWSWNIKTFSSHVNHHHHHVAPSARISLTVSRHFSLSLIASGRSSGLQPVSSHSCCM